MKITLRTTLLTLGLMVLSVTSLSAVDRGLGSPKSVFIPKGTVAFSLSDTVSALTDMAPPVQVGVHSLDLYLHLPLIFAGRGPMPGPVPALSSAEE